MHHGIVKKADSRQCWALRAEALNIHASFVSSVGGMCTGRTVDTFVMTKQHLLETGQPTAGGLVQLTFKYTERESSDMVTYKPRY